MSAQEKYWISSREGITSQHLSVLNEYLLSIKLANKADATIIKYRWILERFLRDCSIPLKDLTSGEVQQWLNVYSFRKKPKTIDLFLACLSSFFKFCQEEDYMEGMVMKKRWRPRITQALPRYLNEQEYARVKLAAERLSLRNRALILFFLSSGCRRAEISNLNIEDIDFNKRTAEVKGKGSKIRFVHFTEECALVLIDYLKERSSEQSDPLFLNRKGNRLLPKGIYEITKRFGQKIGINLHPHCFRHTFATNMLARGASLEFIADEMGHANLNTTRIYARIPTEDMMMAYQSRMG
ncbi:tyrosine-type recombinase/integrase [Fictibacillus sp. 7GRE50]|uniref:tyrosine-type recombinase/integrase n=1 Tax=Fictibacillus sp. 7GRE50 TaxID=2745878 RepID=UPI0018CF3F5E|nr:tyrosine-type recombinase/integrase [Fictibacillus sp. 7GRE50]MBH0164096.1 tyrosine-type recombinase/integrase [Fictibacillus sp. 7GRE50]